MKARSRSPVPAGQRGSGLVPVLLLVVVAAAVGWLVYRKLGAGEAAGSGKRESPPAPVEVASIESGPIELHRTFVGELEAPAQFAVAAKVGGRIERLAVDISDPVTRGQVVAWLDDDEFVQAVAQSEADLAVAKANLAEAKSALEIAERALERSKTLRERGVASEQQYDLAMAEEMAKRARLSVAGAQVTRAEASLAAAKIRLGYTKVTAGWSGEEGHRVVAERHVQGGDTVSANAPLLTIVDLHPLEAVIYITERDFARLEPGQTATLVTDAYPGESFPGTVTRIAPVFSTSTRQVRVELEVPNPGQRLKPGMFVRATLVLSRVEQATVVPYRALTVRDDRPGVFLVSDDGTSVRWCAVEVGIRDGERQQVEGIPPTGRVVTLGQQLVDDGSPVTIPDSEGEGS